MATLTSHEPATGAELWRAAVGDPAIEVARARAAQPAWARQPLDGADGARIRIEHKPHGVLAVLGPYCMPPITAPTLPLRWRTRSRARR